MYRGHLHLKVSDRGPFLLMYLSDVSGKLARVAIVLVRLFSLFFPTGRFKNPVWPGKEFFCFFIAGQIKWVHGVG